MTTCHSKEQFDTCSWCNKKDTIITCANCGKGVEYGKTYPRQDKLRICEECYGEIQNFQK